MDMDFSDSKDVERTSVNEIPSETSLLASYGLERDPGGFIGWRNDSKEHPRNWSTRRKVYNTTLIIVLELYTYVL